MTTAAVSGPSTCNVNACSLPASGEAAPFAESLLTAPSEVPSDPLSVLYYCESKQSQLATGDGERNVENLQKRQGDALQQEHDAIQKEIDAASHKSFWDQLGGAFGEVAKAAAAVASVAAAAATAGAATPLAAIAIAGATLSTAGFADSELHVLKQLGVSDQTADILDTAMMAGGGAASMGASIVAGTSSTVTAAATLVGGVGMVGAGSARIGAGEAQADADRATADQIGARARQDAMGRSTQRTIDQMRDSENAASAYLDTIVETKQTQDATTLAAAEGGEGARS